MFAYTKNNISYKQGKYFYYQLRKNLTLKTRSLTEIKILINILNKLSKEKKLSINKNYLRTVSIELLEGDTLAECDPDNKIIYINSLIISDFMRRQGLTKINQITTNSNKLINKISVCLLHEYIHCVDYNTEFSLSNLILKEYFKAISKLRKLSKTPNMFKIKNKQDFLYECSEGLPHFRDMSVKDFSRFHNDHKKEVVKLGYVTPYAFSSPQEFVAEHLSVYLLSGINDYFLPSLKNKLNVLKNELFLN